jgi:uncharacterized membrane protein YkoI
MKDMRALALTLALLGLPVSSLHAQSLLEPEANLIPQPDEALVSPEAAALQAQARHGGRVLSVQLERPSGGAPFYRVKLLSNGNVRVVTVDARP